MNTDIQTTMNDIDRDTDTLLSLSMKSDDRDAAKILEDYANNLMDLSAQTWRRLRERPDPA